MKKFTVVCALCTLVLFLSYCRKDDVSSGSEDVGEALSGGESTTFDFTSAAFGQPFSSLSSADQSTFEAGRQAFRSTYVTEPATINGGLGPLFINTSCVSCHHNDAIGLPTSGAVGSSMLIRLSIPGEDAHGGPVAVPGFGPQLQNMAVFGVAPEGKVNISYTEKSYQFKDGESYSLRTPAYTLTDLYTSIPSNLLLSPRFASPMTGLGLLEAVPESEIVANADPNDADHDGIKGKPNYVWDESSATTMIGRFGWKANTATLLTQTAKAFNQDIGLTSLHFPHDNSYGQPQSDGYNDDPELDESVINNVLFYSQTLAVPARRNVTDPAVQKGKALFIQAGCESCHKQTLTTEKTSSVAYSSRQEIHPYTDLLLHDMGAGLGDNRPDFLAGGTEWRTAPLWGIGLYEKVNYPGFYLHDGRARTLTEAIMWHSGEAETSKTYFEELSKTDREAVLSFLRSL